MRDQRLFTLFSSVSRLKGVGPQAALALARLMGQDSPPLIRDVLFHTPVGVLDRRLTYPLSEAPDGALGTFVVTVEAHQAPATSRFNRGKAPYKVITSNDTGDLTLIFFNATNEYLKRQLPVGEQRVVSGRVERFDYRLQMSHPDIIAPLSELKNVQRVEAVYPLTHGLTSRKISSLVAQVLATLPSLPEWIEPAYLEQQHWLGWKAALYALHHPQDEAELAPDSLIRARLAYDETLATQLHLAQLRSRMQQKAGEVIPPSANLKTQLLAQLPFRLTAGQQQVLAEIERDLASGQRMVRLLQGDVGSGKTIIALLAMLSVVEQGCQSALMVPTELIAEQHMQTISKLCQGLPVRIARLTGSVKGSARQEILSGLADGSIQIIIGTHALFQEQVQFHQLAFTIIDEQHRFGVSQRMALSAKGNNPHILHMTATPIPRSLTMTLYGDMECSLLTEKPAERIPITTRLIALSRYGELMSALQHALERGEKAYWICPLIEDSSASADSEADFAAAQLRYTEFKQRFSQPQVAMLHGRMKSDERHAAMQRFSHGEAKLLVATTVVEVGVDVRDATIIVIEQAERFGLAQLHQLRGRVGRGDKPSSCVLLYKDNSEAAKARLNILRETEDGFRIAEEDLRQRGAGEILGTRQSGIASTQFLDLRIHQPLLEHANAEARKILAENPDLTGQRGEALKLLMQVFGYEE